MDSTKPQPVPGTKLEEIAIAACDSTFQFVDSYEHSKTESWNTNIINTTLKSLIAETSTETHPPQYKFVVMSTVIQHITSSAQAATGDQSDDAGKSSSLIARRGMHAATGAYWNNEKDGMWNWKYDKGEEKGFDVVMSIVWVSIV